MKEKKRRTNKPSSNTVSHGSAASTYAQTSCMFLPKIQNSTHFRDKIGAYSRKKARRVMHIHSSQGPTKPPKPSPGFHTRIHWESPDEGWIGGGSNPVKPDRDNLFSDDNFAELIKDSFDSH
ncbi:unnamed protein product [Microthlaspi erraticum]|uniref:Uncharacterized protein n=1 Tax=Microthlaspi erraticum TaxID=1685480 RepID=A0A6D2J7V2_9BRAS|nr:unnamed protein product [Microthlaspi erraticum]CAA7057845.1 unnamed protein product [Microthlaspi erraticum]